MSRFDDPVIITCSISGAIANRDQCPAIPYTPEEYAAEARRAVDEGASQIHIHARTPDGTPSYEIEDFRAITEAIRAEVPDVIVNYSTGAIGVPLEKRIAYLRELKPDVAALNMSSMNYAKYSRRREDFVFKAVFENSFDTIIELIEAMSESGIQPEHECFDAGHVANLDPLLAHGPARAEPLQISLVMGVTGGIRPDAPQRRPHGRPDPGRTRGTEQLAGDRRLAATSGSCWRRSLVLGGNVRAGLEDNLYLPERRDGPLERRPDRQGADHGRGHRPPRRDDRRGAGDARAARAGGGLSDGGRASGTDDEHHARIVWEGTQGRPARPPGRACRRRRCSRSSMPERGGDPERADPEEMFVASLSSCHMLWFLALARERRLRVISYEDDAVGELDGVRITRGRAAAPGSSSRTSPGPRSLAELHHGAHERCFLAASVNFPVEVVAP